MNKGLEVIEAHYLFGADYDHIEAVIHPQVGTTAATAGSSSKAAARQRQQGRSSKATESDNHKCMNRPSFLALPAVHHPQHG